jgi:long-chain acyl-CoA synthetase
MTKTNNMNKMDNILNEQFLNAIRKNGNLPAFSDYNGESFDYNQVALKIKFYHDFFKNNKIRKGDKIALLGANSSAWAVAYLAIITYGTVAVPILPDFSADNIHHIVNHSEAKLLIVSNTIYERLEAEKMRNLEGIMELTTNALLYDEKGHLAKALKEVTLNEKHSNFPIDELKFASVNLDDICLISYTSGTSGFTKGVMLPQRSILSNIIFAQENMPLKPGDKIVSFLPMAHAYGMLFEFLFPFTLGCHITFLTKIPSPAIITKAFGEIKPHLILSVPLVIEKIYKKRILPKLDKPAMKLLLKMPGISTIIHNKVKNVLTETFGGRFHEIVIGGAPLSEEVEQFFRKIGFRFTVGYGMTECGPLITYTGWKNARYRSAGKVVDRMEIKIIPQSPDSEVGEILVKGDNLMKGYYHNEEATKEAFTPDGWLKTGDLGYLDTDGFLYIKGRSKNMILGPSGQNIYPEELEAKIANLPCVQECVIKMNQNKLIAMIYPDREAMECARQDFQDIKRKTNEMVRDMNKTLPRYEQISSIEIVDEEFAKTPKRNIKRYLYT